MVVRLLITARSQKKNLSDIKSFVQIDQVFFLKFIDHLIYNRIAGDVGFPHVFADQAHGKIKVQLGREKLLNLFP